MSSFNKRHPRHRAETPKFGAIARRKVTVAGAGLAVLIAPLTAGATTLDSELTQESQETVTQALAAEATTNPSITVPEDAEFVPFDVEELVKVTPPKTETTAISDFVAEREREEAEAAAAQEAAEAERARQEAQEDANRAEPNYQVSNAAPSASGASQQASSGATHSTVESSSASGDQVVAIARQYLDVPYVWGGASPSGWDCSGFTSFIYAQVGVSIPQGSSAQRHVGREIPASEARPGDLMWWPGHVGIYTGNGNHIAARNPSSGTQETPIYRDNPVYLRVVG